MEHDFRLGKKKKLFHIKLEKEKVVMGLCLFLNDMIDTIFLLPVVSSISELMNSLLWDSAMINCTRSKVK